MPHTTAFYDWDARINTQFPDLKPHHRHRLAEYSFGMVLAGCCGLSSVVAYLAAFFAAREAADDAEPAACDAEAVADAGKSTTPSALRQRLRELYQPSEAQIGEARSEFDYTQCFAPLVRWAVGHSADKRLVLALDPSCLTDRFRVLCVSVLYRGSALPVAWTLQRADQKGSWNEIWFDLLGKLKAALGEGWTILVLTDRGLESAALFREIVRLGWHPMMRVKSCGKFQPTRWHRGQWMSFFAESVGRRWSGEGVAYPTGDRLACTLLASWDEGHDEAWLLLTDLPATGANAVWYGWRMWMEQGFRAIKRGCWQWHKTQMSDPLRAARLWAVIAVATLYTIEIGGEGQPAELPKTARKLSTLRQGLLRILMVLLTHKSLPDGKIEHHDWPEDTKQSDPLTDPYVHRG